MSSNQEALEFEFEAISSDKNILGTKERKKQRYLDSVGNKKIKSHEVSSLSSRQKSFSYTGKIYFN